MLHQRKARVAYSQQMGAYLAPWTSPGRAITSRALLLGKRLLLTIGEEMYQHHYHHLARLLGISDQRLIPQKTLSAMGAPYYNTFLRGGEGHLEVAKTLYYTRHKLCHLVLALKPFGCLPSVQSDAVQASLMERYPEVRFLPIETCAEGEIHAYSRVQMALSEARASASLEFEQALQSARHSLEDIRSFVAMHVELRHPLYPIPRHPGIISTAANFLMHADQLMSASFTHGASLYPHREHGASHAPLRQVLPTKEIES
jgi:hypothetical protein